MDKDLSRDNEMEAISEMLIEAEKHCLLAEVVWSFAREVKTNDIPQAAAHALHDWDI